jgi:hypothetical protein
MAAIAQEGTAPGVAAGLRNGPLSGDDAVRFLATAMGGPVREGRADRVHVPAGRGGPVDNALSGSTDGAGLSRPFCGSPATLTGDSGGRPAGAGGRRRCFPGRIAGERNES